VFPAEPLAGPPSFFPVKDSKQIAGKPYANRFQLALQPDAPAKLLNGLTVEDEPTVWTDPVQVDFSHILFHGVLPFVERRIICRKSKEEER
jgi:hypothetical protein